MDNANSSSSIVDSTNLMHSYSSIIGPEDYNDIMTNQHLYISTADRFVALSIKRMSEEKNLEVVELGCGPARLLQLLAEIDNIKLSAVDIDPLFIEHAKKIVLPINPNVNILCSDVTSFKHNKPVDIFCSQGFHHHVEKGEQTRKYLLNLYSQLKDGGMYIISDEFVPNYVNDEDRNIKLVIWYSHIIAHAARHGYSFLAQEEAKTLLDDLEEGVDNSGVKTQNQINLVLESVKEIDDAAKLNNMSEANSLAYSFLKKLKELFNMNISGDSTMDLSRHDYKICESVFRKEAEEVGFTIESVKHFGPIENIGGMSVYILKK